MNRRVLLGAGLMALPLAACGRPSAERPVAQRTHPPAPASPSTRRTARPLTPLAPVLQPSRLAIPSLGVDAPVVPIRLAGTTLVPPSDPDTLGWWAASHPAGDSEGATVIVGHTVESWRRKVLGPGALGTLGKIRPGARLTVDGQVEYRAGRVVEVSQAEFAARSAEFMPAAGEPCLVLVTCSGWDGRVYHNNLVLRGTPT